MMDKLKTALDKGVASVSVKSSVYVETTKISTQISNIQAEIQGVKASLAEMVYSKWKDNAPYQEDAEGMCKTIADFESQIEQLKSKMQQLKEDSRVILGEKTEPGCCASCGTQNGANAKFCFKCGAKMN